MDANENGISVGGTAAEDRGAPHPPTTDGARLTDRLGRLCPDEITRIGDDPSALPPISHADRLQRAHVAMHRQPEPEGSGHRVSGRSARVDYYRRLRAAVRSSDVTHRLLRAIADPTPDSCADLVRGCVASGKAEILAALCDKPGPQIRAWTDALSADRRLSLYVAWGYCQLGDWRAAAEYLAAFRGDAAQQPAVEAVRLLIEVGTGLSDPDWVRSESLRAATALGPQLTDAVRPAMPQLAADAALIRAKLLTAHARIDEASQELFRAYKLAPPTPHEGLLLTRAHLMARLGAETLLGDAYAEALEAVRQYPCNAEARLVLAHVAARRLDRRACSRQLERLAACTGDDGLCAAITKFVRAWLEGDAEGGLRLARDHAATDVLGNGIQQAVAQPLRNRDHLVNLYLGYALRFALAAEADDLCEPLSEQAVALPAFFRSPDLSLLRAAYLQRRGRGNEARRILEASARHDTTSWIARGVLGWPDGPTSRERVSTTGGYLPRLPLCDMSCAYLAEAADGDEDPVTPLLVRCLPRPLSAATEQATEVP